MIVADASVIIELLLNTDAAEAIAERLDGEPLHAPEILDLEVLQVLRRYRLREHLTARRAGEAVNDLALLRIERHGHGAHRDRIWQLHENLTAYDAAYVSVAEVLDVPLVTLDARLARSTGHEARIELIGGQSRDFHGVK